MSNEVKGEPRPVKVGMISLGCAKNLVDAEVMLGSLVEHGIALTNDPIEADVVIVNTCSFIEAAQQESIDAILESAQLRDAKNRGQGLIVSGCLPQRFRDELPKLLPEVDAFMGIDQVGQVKEIVEEALRHRADKLNPRASPSPQLRTASPLRSRTRKDTPASSKAAVSPPLVRVHSRPTYIPDYGTPRFRLTPNHFAYLKIAEGCNHPCSFCIIPRMRGAHRSRALADILKEAEQLLESGVKELNLISQDSTYYGLDLRSNRAGSIASPERFGAATRALPANVPTLCTLLRELNRLPGKFWIRLLYTHPAHWTDELIATIAECPKVARYVDMPLQHIHHNMLERMRRETSQAYIEELIQKIRRGIPQIALRTTFIVGFPGETEASFEVLLNFVRETRFERLGVFTYSHQEGTLAARMSGQVPLREKKRRRARLLAEQLKIARSISRAFVGKEMEVLVERKAVLTNVPNDPIVSWEHGDFPKHHLSSHLHKLDGPFSIARGEVDAPDIDGRIYVRGHLPLGQFSRVKILGATDYDLVAEPLS